MMNSEQPDGQRITSSTDNARNPVDELADEFVDRLRRGELPSVTEYANRHPELADEIREVLPTLAMLEKCGEEESAAAGGGLNSGDAPEQLGEYQIIREVARGGMGIVYEAEHETMRRRVALKVLPAQMASRGSHLERFHREARAAGRLHHTNIVPVFEVGADRGYYYYAMQFIQGQSLDVVFDELRRLQNETGVRRISGAPQPESSLSRSVAWSLKSGRYQAPVQDSPEFDLAETVVGPPATPRTPRQLPSATMESFASSADSTARIARPAATASSPSDLAESSVSGDSYCHRVAHVGLQVAEALSYAHGQRVLHRDIKPSNIILDMAGVAWVTDFGLAKNDDGDLTQSGDLVGTFRYMAPERFKGDGDARCDVYGLGLTLYELCTLQPAFAEADRLQLINVITNQDPIPPRRINSQVPRDLETIILKAIDRQPSRRYASAEDLAEDLSRFLSDRPILARRSSIAEQALRLCRKNPLPTALAACMFVLVGLLVVGSLRFGYVSQRQAQELREETMRALQAERDALLANRLATKHLYELNVGRADSGRFSGRIGQNFATMESIAQASSLLSELDFSASKRDREKTKLRNLAIAAMSLIDLREQESWEIGQPTALTLDRDYKLLARASGRIITIGRPGASTPEVKISGFAQPAWRLAFSDDSSYLVSRHHRAGAAYSAFVSVWRAENGEKVWQLRKDLQRAFFAVSPNSHELAIGRRRGAVDICSLADGSVSSTLPTGFDPIDVAFDATGGRLACATRNIIQIWDVGGKQPSVELKLKAPVSKIAWNSKHAILAAGTTEGHLTVWHDAKFELPPWQLEPHLGARVVRLAIHPSGELLVSKGWDGFIRVNDLTTQQQALQVDRGGLLECGFSQDGGSIAYTTNSTLGVWTLSTRPLDVMRSNAKGDWRGASYFHPKDGRLLVSPTTTNIELWDVDRRRVIDTIDVPRARCQIAHDGSSLLSADTSGIRRWPIEIHESTEELQVEVADPQVVYKGEVGRFCTDKSGRYIAIDAGSTNIVVVDLENPSATKRIGPHPGLDRVAMTPDGRRVISSTWQGWDVRVWDRESGKLVKALGSRWGSMSIAISGDGRRLLASAKTKLATWDTESWRPFWRRDRNADDWPGPVAFSNDGSFVACCASRYVPQLCDTYNGTSIAILEAPKTEAVGEFSFSVGDETLAIQSASSIHLWDLKTLENRLAALGLSWKQ